MFIYALCGGNKEVSVKLNTGTYVTFARVLQYACIFFEICFSPACARLAFNFCFTFQRHLAFWTQMRWQMFVQGT